MKNSKPSKHDRVDRGENLKITSIRLSELHTYIAKHWGNGRLIDGVRRALEFLHKNGKKP